VKVTISWWFRTNLIPDFLKITKAEIGFGFFNAVLIAARE
jgi:hypothetical protein